MSTYLKRLLGKEGCLLIHPEEWESIAKNKQVLRFTPVFSNFSEGCVWSGPFPLAEVLDMRQKTSSAT